MNTIKSRFLSSFSKILTCIAITAGAFVLVGFALRPYKTLFEPLGLTQPEWFIAGIISMIFFITAARRLFQGNTSKQEMNTFLEASNDLDG